MKQDQHKVGGSAAVWYNRSIHCRTTGLQSSFFPSFPALTFSEPILVPGIMNNYIEEVNPLTDGHVGHQY